MPLLSSCLDYCQTFINFGQICHFYKIVICQDAPFCHLICIWPNSWTLYFFRNLTFSPKFAIFWQSPLVKFPLFVTSFEFLANLWWILAQSPIFLICQFRELANCQYCLVAVDVTAAMLVVKNKSICLLWEPNFIFMLIIREKLYCIDPQHCRLVSWLQTKNASFVVSFKIFVRPLINANSPISKNSFS